MVVLPVALIGRSRARTRRVTPSYRGRGGRGRGRGRGRRRAPAAPAELVAREEAGPFRVQELALPAADAPAPDPMAGIGPAALEEEGDGEAEHGDSEQRQQDGRDEPLPPELPSEGAAVALPAGVLGLGRTRAGVPGTSASQAAGVAPTTWGRRAAPTTAAR
ncbi:hypothetical protein ZWY2020_053737 [Hordeum vulgare]|nr:hypothetical protein ZWY2020_053737 [Hordeum vulgare]